MGIAEAISPESDMILMKSRKAETFNLDGFGGRLLGRCHSPDRQDNPELFGSAWWRLSTLKTIRPKRLWVGNGGVLGGIAGRCGSRDIVHRKTCWNKPGFQSGRKSAMVGFRFAQSNWQRVGGSVGGETQHNPC